MAKETNTLKEFLDSEIYSELIRLTDPASIEEKIKDIEISRLHDRLKQRQFLLVLLVNYLPKKNWPNGICI